MDLLPKSSNEFRSKDYWDKFFSARGGKSFDWYGEYTDLCEYLNKYMKPHDEILMAGCGNASITESLYKVGFRNITNIDISETVIKKMKEKYSSECSDLKWIQGDLFNTEFESDTFSCVLDKGTLDAIMSAGKEDREEVNSNVKRYFEELRRILRIGGRFICISLLQNQILSAILDWFPQNGWFIRICRCFDAEKAQMARGGQGFPTFMIICTKFKLLDNFKPIIELNLEEGQLIRADSAKAIEAVESVQQFSLIRYNLRKKLIINNEIKLDLFDQEERKKRYVLYVVDTPKSTNDIPFAVFIVPHGRETEYLFGNYDGQRKLAEDVKADRLIIIHLMREQTYESMAEIQKELEPKILELAPPRMPYNFKIPFLSAGDDLGDRKEVCKGSSTFSGDFLVEDVRVLDSNDYLRRLIFLKNQHLVQSEARLRCEKGRRKKKLSDPPLLTLDPSYLSCVHHTYMLTAFQYTSYKASALLIGLGGGALATFIHNYFPDANLIAVDIDEEIVNIAKEWFNFETDSNLVCEIQDGIKFIEREACKGSKYDIIMFDIDSKEINFGLSCPPKQFLEKSFLQKVADCLDEDGIFTVNLVCRCDILREQIIKELKSLFPTMFSISVPGEVNMVVFCMLSTETQIRLKDFKRKILDLNKYLVKEINQRDNVLKICDMLKNFKIL